MFSDYIRIAVAHILSEHRGGIERCCGSCNPSCDDLTRFICFGHTIEEVNEWINTHQQLLQAEYENMFNNIDSDIHIDITVDEKNSSELS